MKLVMAAFIIMFAAVPHVLTLLDVPFLPSLVWSSLFAQGLISVWLLYASVRYQRERKDMAAAIERSEAAKISAALKFETEQSILKKAAYSFEEQLRHEQQKTRLRLSELEAAVVIAGQEGAINLVGLLQQKGRFLDFVMDDITRYPDAQIGAAARVVHQGCSAVIRDSLGVKPADDASEGSELSLGKDYDSARYRLVGRVIGEPPFRGRILHRGWIATKAELPRRLEGAGSHDGMAVIAPAEIELH